MKRYIAPADVFKKEMFLFFFFAFLFGVSKRNAKIDATNNKVRFDVNFRAAQSSTAGNDTGYDDVDRNTLEKRARLKCSFFNRFPLSLSLLNANVVYPRLGETEFVGQR